MMMIILMIVTITAIYFAFRYFSLVAALYEMTEQLREIQKDLNQNQMLHLPVPNRHLGKVMCAVNDSLTGIQKERQNYRKREKEFQKQIENISHDLRTPLTVILGYLKLIRKTDTGCRMDDETAEMLAVIGKKAENMKSLVTQFYDYSRLNAGDYNLKPGRVDVSRVLRESLMGNYQVFEQADLEITADIPEYPVWILGEETALDRVFLNLLQNAGRYAKSFLHIAMKTEVTKITILFVNDTEKLTEDDIPHLFDRFYMQDSARSRGGTGLGLTVAKSLTEQMEGSLEVHITEHEGADNQCVLCFELSMKPY